MVVNTCRGQSEPRLRIPSGGPPLTARQEEAARRTDERVPAADAPPDVVAGRGKGGAGWHQVDPGLKALGCQPVESTFLSNL